MHEFIVLSCIQWVLIACNELCLRKFDEFYFLWKSPFTRNHWNYLRTSNSKRIRNSNFRLVSIKVHQIYWAGISIPHFSHTTTIKVLFWKERSEDPRYWAPIMVTLSMWDGFWLFNWLKIQFSHRPKYSKLN